MEPIYRRFSGNLKRLLKAKGYTAERLAYESGIDKGNLSRVIAGKQGASMDLMQKIADTFEVDIQELFVQNAASSASNQSKVCDPAPRRGTY
jgi:transcriptional regulator with XRE-family HTH domain